MLIARFKIEKFVEQIIILLKELFSWFKETTNSYISEHVLLAMIFSFTIFISIVVLSFLIVPRYKRRLYNNIFPDENPWLMDNSPDDIYVSIQANLFNESDSKSTASRIEYDLSRFMSKRLLITNEFYVILGRAGEGKTLSLCKIAKDIIDGYKNLDNKTKKTKEYKKLLPIFLRFSELGTVIDEDGFFDAIQNKIFQISHLPKVALMSMSLIKKHIRIIIKAYLRKGKCVILIDGYDEITNDEQRLQCSNVVIDFANKYNKNNYIVTSRLSVYEKEPFINVKNIKELYLLPFNKEKIKEFLSKYSFPNNKSGSELYQRIINTPQIENVVSNPLLLTMVTHLYSKSSFQFTNSKTHLYEGCCNCLLDEWDKNKSRLYRRINKNSESLNIEEKNELLSILAYEIYKNKSEPVETKTVEKTWSSKFFNETNHTISARKALEKIINGSGLLQRIKTNSKEFIKFHHRSFYEYYVALYFKNDKLMFMPSSRNDNAISFFYLALTQSDSLLQKYSENQYMDIRTLCDLLLEIHTDNTSLVNYAIGEYINQLDLNNINDIIELGYLALTYDYTQTRVSSFLRYELCTLDKTIKLNILICYMLFEDKEKVKQMFSRHISDIELNDLVSSSGEILDEYANMIIGMQKSYSDKLTFIELLAKNDRFSAMFNLFKSNSETETKELSVIGMLYMSQNMDLFKWLNNKSFLNTAYKNELIACKELKKKYKWAGNELSNEEQDCLFYIVLLSKSIFQNNKNLNVSLISHRILFLISYILSEETNIIVNYTDIEGVDFESKYEFANHWNRIRIYFNTNISSISINAGMNLVSLSRVNIFGILLFAAFQVGYFLNNCSLQLKRNISIFNYINDIKRYPFDSQYIIIMAISIFILLLINRLLRKGHHSIWAFALNMLLGTVYSYMYFELITIAMFRYSFYMLLFFIIIIEIIKNRVNYPSLRNPYFKKVQNYLRNDKE